MSSNEIYSFSRMWPFIWNGCAILSMYKWNARPIELYLHSCAKYVYISMRCVFDGKMAVGLSTNHTKSLNNLARICNSQRTIWQCIAHSHTWICVDKRMRVCVCVWYQRRSKRQVSVSCYFLLFGAGRFILWTHIQNLKLILLWNEWLWIENTHFLHFFLLCLHKFIPFFGSSCKTNQNKSNTYTYERTMQALEQYQFIPNEWLQIGNFFRFNTKTISS